MLRDTILPSVSFRKEDGTETTFVITATSEDALGDDFHALYVTAIEEAILSGDLPEDVTYAEGFILPKKNIPYAHIERERVTSEKEALEQELVQLNIRLKCGERVPGSESDDNN